MMNLVIVKGNLFAANNYNSLVIPVKQHPGPRILYPSALMKMNMSIAVAADALLESPWIVTLTQTQQLGLGFCDQGIPSIRDE